MTQIKTDANRFRDESTDAWLVAAQINVYMEAIRRKGRRVILGPGDIHRLFTMISILLEANAVDNSPVEQPRPANPTEDEAEAVLNHPEEGPSPPERAPEPIARRHRIG